MSIRRFAPIAVVLSLVLAIPGTASATARVYCVGTTDASCTDAGIPSLGTALIDAAGNPGPDTILIGAHSNTSSSGLSYTDGAANPVAIRGIGAVTLTDNSSTTNTAVLSLGPGSSVSDMMIAVPDTATLNLGLILKGASASGVTVSDSGSGVHQEIGVQLQGTAPQFTGGTVTLNDQGSGGTGDIVGIYSIPAVGAPALVSDTTVTAGPGSKSGSAIVVDGFATHNGQTVIQRTTATGGSVDVVTADTAQATVEDSVLPVPVVAGAGALRVFSTAAVTVRNDTIAGTGSGTAILMSQGSAGANTVTLDSTIVRGAGITIARDASAGSNPVTVRYSDIDLSSDTQTGAGATDAGTPTGTPVNGGNVNVTPGFVSTTDLRLGPGSPLIDAGDPAALVAGESATDRLSLARVQDGNADGVAVRDIGAYEFPAPPVAVVPIAVPAPIPAPPPPPAPAPIPLPNAEPAAKAPSIKLRSSHVVVTRKGGAGSLSISCTAPTGDRCKVTGTLAGVLPKAHAAKAGKPAKKVTLGHVTGTVSAGGTGHLKLVLTHSARSRVLSAALRGTLTLTIGDRAGGHRRLTGRALKVTAAPIPHHKAHHAG